jgi:hypothetical protein
MNDQYQIEVGGVVMRMNTGLRNLTNFELIDTSVKPIEFLTNIPDMTSYHIDIPQKLIQKRFFVVEKL